MKKLSQPAWKIHDRFLELRSNWLTLIGEHLQDHQGQILEYWRIEKADSVVIIPIQSNYLILPPLSYRPGLGELTLDFPGGRAIPGQNPDTAVPAILQRELGVELATIGQIIPLNTEGWAVNSSFSNQKLYGFVAYLQPHPIVASEYVGATYPATSTGVHDLLQHLICLQCRAVLMEWWLKSLNNNW
ncbi:NUDIX hydrolase [Nostoc sp. UHCC 0870]|uniref:NUDIX hydrolase n=1 Tax=Nostoc sp. UHCC 0870 TaxID=2914041 RepID=UPI001EDED9EE|nr:NUDIX hydrolase [Nostoc sp. UHCC 0870]UKO98219.1 NUDIX hydrolase [Nostoc sp. UHCC 0870]